MSSLSRRRLFSSLVLALVLGAGALLTWTVAAMWVVSLVEEWVRAGKPYVSLVITRDGEPLLSWNEYNSLSRTTFYRTLDGRNLPTDGKTIAMAQSTYLRVPDAKLQILSWSERINAFQAGPGERREQWFLVHDGRLPGHVYLEGYDEISKSVIGYLDRDGYRLDKPPLDAQFVVDRPLGYQNGLYAVAPGIRLQNHMLAYPAALDSNATDSLLYLIANDGLHSINLDQRTISAVDLPERPLSVAHLAIPVVVKVPPEEGQEERSIEINEPRVVVRLTDNVLMLDRQGRTLLTTPLPAAARDESVTYHLCANNRVVMEVNRAVFARKPELFWYDAEGTQTASRQVELPDFWSGRPMFWLMGLIYPTPAVVAFIYYVAPRQYTAVELWPAIVILLVFSIVSAVVVYRHAKRYAQPGAAAWAAFALVFGLPVLAGYWLHRAWPHREHCRSCGELVPRDRLACAICSTDFVPPARTGIEVFA